MRREAKSPAAVSAAARARPAMRIDRYVPVSDVRDYHEARVAAEPPRAYAALRALDLNRSGIVRALFAIRTLPTCLREGRPPARPSRPFLVEALGAGFVVLEEDPGREIVVGAVTQPWQPVVRFRGLPPEEFVRFSEPGFTKIAWNLAARPLESGGTRVSIETRVAATDPVSRRRFRRYWFFASSGIRLIRVLALRMLRKDLGRTEPARAAAAARR